MDEYFKRRKENQLEEAVNFYHSYIRRYNQLPTEELFHEYFFLFSSGKTGTLNPSFERKMHDHGCFNESLNAWNNNKPIFESFIEFCKYAENH